MAAFAAAIEFEALKFRRAPVAWAVSVLLGVALPVLGAVFVAAATAAPGSQIGLKAAAMLTAPGWPGYLGILGMLWSVAGLVGVGFMMCWCFGREFTEKTHGCLFALPVSRQQLAYAKFAVTLGWSLAICLLSVVVALGAGAVLGLGMPGLPDLVFAAKAWSAGILAALLACPLAAVASFARGYLPAVGALVLLVVITQVITAFGAGAWLPFAAPGLWMGMGGPAAAAAVHPVHLALCILVAALAIAVTGQGWKRLGIVAG